MEYPCIITFLLLFSAYLLVLGGASSTHQDDDFLECLTKLSNSATDIIYTPKNASSFASLLLARNLRPESTSPRKPLLVVTPFHESEIQAAIHCSKKLGVQIRIRSGGHDYEGLSYTSENPFVVLDMRNLQSISINTEEKTAWVQAGATLGQFYYAIAQESRTLGFTAGVCPTVGVGGHFSGGGYGMMSRKHAIAADNIIDVKIINANGRILDRESMGEDHFWAIRGGGGTSFGIILAYKVKLVTVPETVTVFNVTRTLEQNATRLVHRWQYVAHKVDKNLLLRLFLTSVTSPTTGKRTIVASFTSLYLGRVHDLLPLMQEKFPELGLVEQDCIEMSWIESVRFFARLHNHSLDILLRRTLRTPRYFKGKSDFVRQPIPVKGLRGIWRFIHEEAESMAELQFSPYGGVLNTFSESETPFPHRSGNIFMIHYVIFWAKPGNNEAERHINWIRRLYRYMTPYVSKSPRAAYFNYRDLDIGMNNEGNTSYKQASVLGDLDIWMNIEEKTSCSKQASVWGDDVDVRMNNEAKTSYKQASVWGFKYFKNNFSRLVRVKTMVDPFNFFRNEQSIPPISSW